MVAAAVRGAAVLPASQVSGTMLDLFDACCVKTADVADSLATAHQRPAASAISRPAFTVANV